MKKKVLALVLAVMITARMRAINFFFIVLPPFYACGQPLAVSALAPLLATCVASAVTLTVRLLF